MVQAERKAIGLKFSRFLTVKELFKKSYMKTSKKANYSGRKNGIICVTIKSRLEAGLAPAFEKTIKEIIASKRRRLLFDLSALDYLWSSVLRVILNAVKEIKHKSGRVVLFCWNGCVKEIFEVNRFKNTITDSVESGLETLSCSLKAA